MQSSLQVSLLAAGLALIPGSVSAEEDSIPDIPDLGETSVESRSGPSAAAKPAPGSSPKALPPPARAARAVPKGSIRVDESLLFDAGRLAQSTVSAPQPPRPEVLQVDASGDVVPVSWERKSKWIWINAAEGARALRPVLRSWFRLPAGVRVEGFSSKALKRVDLEVAGASPFSNEDRSGEDTREILVVDADASSGSAVVKTRTEAGSDFEETGILIRFQFSGPLVWTHSSCAEAGVSMQLFPDEKAAVPENKFVFLSLHCLESGAETLLHLQQSADSSIQSVLFPDPATGKLGFDPRAQGMQEAGIDWIWSRSLAERSRRSWPKSTAARTQAIGAVRVGKTGAKGLRFGLFQVEKPPTPPSLSYFANVGFSYLDYVEDKSLVTELSSTQFVTTVKGGLAWKFWQPRWDTSVSGFVSALFLSQSLTPPLDVSGNPISADFGPARFYGLNGRIGYLVSSPRAPWEWKLSLGGYYWGMLVDGNLYGIRSMVGPQVLLTLRNSQNPRRRWGSYFKFAATGDSAGFRLSNREIAFGADYQIATLGRSMPLSLTLDLAQAGYVTADAAKNMNLNSASLGIQTAF